MSHRLRLAVLPLVLAASTALGDDPKPGGRTLTGKDALGDWTTDAPGVRRKITVDDLATPYDTPSANNFPRVVPRPEGAWPKAPEGFEVTEFATGLTEPRVIVRAPNGDLFLAESRANRVRVFRDADGDGKPEVNEVFATGLNRPFGIAFYPVGPEPKYVYVGNTDSVVRFPYKNGDTKASGEAETIVKDIPSGNEQRRRRRALDARPGVLARRQDPVRLGRLAVERRRRRAARSAGPTSWRSTPTARTSASSPTASATRSAWPRIPKTGQLWTSVNERDGLGDHLVPDYITHVEEGGFYGWPWYYIGPNQDPRHKGKHPELKDKVIVPDVLLQSHMASLDMTFYDGDQFPKEYRHDAFAAEHGSWNRARRTGYKVIRVPMKDGKATGEYEDFLVGFVTKEGNVWGRPVGRGRGQGRVVDGDRRRLGDGLAGGVHGEEVSRKLAPFRSLLPPQLPSRGLSMNVRFAGLPGELGVFGGRFQNDDEVNIGRVMRACSSPRACRIPNVAAYSSACSFLRLDTATISKSSH